MKKNINLFKGEVQDFDVDSTKGTIFEEVISSRVKPFPVPEKKMVIMTSPYEKHRVILNPTPICIVSAT